MCKKLHQVYSGLVAMYMHILLLLIKKIIKKTQCNQKYRLKTFFFIENYTVDWTGSFSFTANIKSRSNTTYCSHTRTRRVAYNGMPIPATKIRPVKKNAQRNEAIEIIIIKTQ